MGEQGRGLPWGLLAALLGSPPAGKSWAFSGVFCSLFFGWGRDRAGGEMRILRPLLRVFPRATHQIASVPGGLVIRVLSFRLAVAVWRSRGEDGGSRGSRKPRAAPQALPRAEHHPSAPLREHFSHFPQITGRAVPAVPCRGHSTRHSCSTRTPSLQLPTGSPSPAGEPTPSPTLGRARYLPPCPGLTGGPVHTSFWLLSGD